MITPSDLTPIKNRETLVAFLRDQLGWHAPPEVEAEELFYDISSAMLRVDKRTGDAVTVRQLAPFVAGQPWGIFLVEMNTERLYRTHARNILRGLVPNRKSDSRLRGWELNNILFIAASPNYAQVSFAHFKGEQPATAVLSSFGWSQQQARDETGLYTLCKYNLEKLRWVENETDSAAWVKEWSSAFDLQAVTDRFFRDFRDLFEATKAALPKTIRKAADRHAFTQRLLNRLLFLGFLQKKRWLRHPELERPSETYLFDLYDDAVTRKQNFYAEILYDLFFNALNRPPTQNTRAAERVRAKLGVVPFLNGGLFDAADEWDARDTVTLDNVLFENILGKEGLLRRYNFTVTESTPLNQQVAVDPEMLGKVFETVVLTSEEAEDFHAPNLRKATGSYYTPRIVVTFIVREAIQEFLCARIAGLHKRKLAALMMLDATNGLTNDARGVLNEHLDQKQADAILKQIADLTACDPAIGSGAFALGLLHELVNLHLLCLNRKRNADPRPTKPNFVFDLKKLVIEKNLYGVDLQAKAVEICKLRLWLSLIVDFDPPGIDLENASEDEYRDAIAKIPALPNLSYKIRRGDALLDLVEGNVFEYKATAHNNAMFDARKQLIDAHAKFFDAEDSNTKRQLRLDALVARTLLTRLQLEQQRLDLRNLNKVQQELFARHVSAEQKKREAEIDALDAALARVRALESKLDTLKRKRALEETDDALLADLEASTEDDKITFTWELDFPEIFLVTPPPMTTLTGKMALVNETGGQQEFTIPSQPVRGGFDLLVGNPPFVTARNPERREHYRERWHETAHMKFQLVAPFFQRGFGLLKTRGHLGFIVSNAFAKREFGKPLVEDFFPTVELTKVVDCSGLMFPGHGTPTCIVFGRNQTPSPKLGEGRGEGFIRIAATLPGGGDLKTAPEDSPLWKTIEKNHDNAGYSDARIMVADRARKEMAEWPWNIDVSTEPTKQLLENEKTQPLLNIIEGEIGVCTMTNCDDVFPMMIDEARRLKIPKSLLHVFQEGEDIRDWVMNSEWLVLTPYDAQTEIIPESKLGQAREYLLPYKEILNNRLSFGSKTFKTLGRPWYSFERMNVNKYADTNFIAFGEIATHNHFVAHFNRRVYKQTSQTIKLPATNQNDFHALTALLNSSSALFWLKQISFNKNASEEQERDRYVYAGGKVQQLPIPTTALEEGELRERLTELARACWERGQVLPRLAFKKLFQKKDEAYDAWNRALEGWIEPWGRDGEKERGSEGGRSEEGGETEWKTVEELLRAKRIYTAERERLRSEMIALQEEMDWVVYEAYGLITDDRTQNTEYRNIEPLKLGERAFELMRDGKDTPAHFSETRRAVWEARRNEIVGNEHVRRIEQPMYKRRWYRKENDEKEWLRAVEWFILEKAEFYLEHKRGAKHITLQTWADALWQDARVRAAFESVNSEPYGVTIGQAVLDIPRATDNFIKFFKTLVNENAVPEWIPPAMNWEQVEKKYKTKIPARVKKIRGKLNVPRERFRVNDKGEYVWAGSAG